MTGSHSAFMMSGKWSEEGEATFELTQLVFWPA